MMIGSSTDNILSLSHISGVILRFAFPLSVGHSTICMTARNWCFTLNNPESEDIDISEWTEKPKLLIYQKEMGENGTPHLQGYLEMDQPVRLSALKKLLPRAHLEKRQGSRTQAIKYCCKEESRISQPKIIGFEGGLDALLKTLDSQPLGNTSLITLKNMIDNGSSELELADFDFGTWSRNYRALERYKRLKTTPRNTECNVIVIQGPTGTGKSRFCMESFPKAYWKQRGNWWDGYDGQSEVIIDEFYGWMPFDTLLRLCDRYPMLVESKGGQLQFIATTIVFTTNQVPDKWYKNMYMDSFYRRVTTWIIMPDCNNKLQYSNYGEAKEHFIDNNITFIN